EVKRITTSQGGAPAACAVAVMRQGWTSRRLTLTRAAGAPASPSVRSQLRQRRAQASPSGCERCCFAIICTALPIYIYRIRLGSNLLLICRLHQLPLLELPFI